MKNRFRDEAVFFICTILLPEFKLSEKCVHSNLQSLGTFSSGHIRLRGLSSPVPVQKFSITIPQSKQHLRSLKG
jgi:hypothetical protein